MGGPHRFNIRFIPDLIEIVLYDELTDGTVVTVRMLAPLGELLVMAEAEKNERELGAAPAPYTGGRFGAERYRAGASAAACARHNGEAGFRCHHH
jgi:hypothetical protein